MKPRCGFILCLGEFHKDTLYHCERKYDHKGCHIGSNAIGVTYKWLRLDDRKPVVK